ncbi:MAG: STAS domain-containing protein [Sinobacteraceae bacterium]|nr:STAS domain-containing protein [Nevskiaceae bacterium]
MTTELRANSAANGAAVALIEDSPGRFSARGRITFATARAARQTGLAAFDGTSEQQIRVDCSGISASDSAGMAVLLDWLSAARRAGRSLQYQNLPVQVQAIARISDVLEMLERGV